MEMLVAWIKVIKEDEAEGELKLIYDKMREPWGVVGNTISIHSSLATNQVTGC
jgi:hypothetical protein